MLLNTQTILKYADKKYKYLILKEPEFYNELPEFIDLAETKKDAELIIQNYPYENNELYHTMI